MREKDHEAHKDGLDRWGPHQYLMNHDNEIL